MRKTKELRPYGRLAKEFLQELSYVKAVVLLGQTNGVSPNGRNVPIFVVYDGTRRERIYLRTRLYAIANRAEFESGVPSNRLTISLATQDEMVTCVLQGKRLAELALGRVLYDDGTYAALKELQYKIQSTTSGK